MKKRKALYSLVSVLVLGVFLLTGCDIGNSSSQDSGIGNDDSTQEIIENPVTTEEKLPEGSFNPGIVLVKSDDFSERQLGTLSFSEVEPLYRNSSWYKITLDDQTEEGTKNAVDYLYNLHLFEDVDYDYLMGTDSTDYSAVSGNELFSEQTYLDNHQIGNGWNYMKDNKKSPGGSSDVVVAVIDTGVDYNHVDLRDNIWVNTGEVPNNGIDDDGNGYIDDYYGWDFVGDDKDPMDDNGHGTHAAGIIAAQNNSIGTVGVAYNCKVMALKAASSSGYFLNSDIAEAIQYAYMNGASVINMSFGGSSISVAVEEALEEAYNQCILVAAAGNDGLCNNLSHSKSHDTGVSYPAALSYVIGVMSTDCNGSIVSGFSNYDDTPYDSVEYDVYASGEAIPSTWPSNRYARLSGTSMACPIVSGIAALLRSYNSDREIYSSKYIISQIVNTGTKHPYNALLESYDLGHSVIDIYEALTYIPKPAVSLYDYYIFDGTDISETNNGNGSIDAGETIRLAVELKNRGGVASNVTVTAGTIRIGDAEITDPYFTFVNNTLTMSDIGTYSIRDCGLIYDDDDSVVGTKNYIEIRVSEDCPNDYICNVNINFTYTNGLDSEDGNTYSGSGTAQLTVTNGERLPEVISEDTTLTAGKRYIIGNTVVIPEGVTVNVEAGVTIQFYEDYSGYENELLSSPVLQVYGTLNINGTEDNMVNVTPSEKYYKSGGNVQTYINSNVSIKYANLNNVNVDHEKNSELGPIIENSSIIFQAKSPFFDVSKIVSSYIYVKGEATKITGADFDAYYFNDNAVIAEDVVNTLWFSSYYEFNNNILFSKEATFNISHVDGQTVWNNVFVSGTYDKLGIAYGDNREEVSNNCLMGTFKTHAVDLISNLIASDGTYRIDPNYIPEEYGCSFPFITDIKLSSADGEETKTVGKEQFTVDVTFSQDMDTSVVPSLYFGSSEPYADYKITGEFVSARQWRGTYEMKAFIENGTQTFSISNCYSADGYELVDTSCLFGFDIDTTEAMSMNLTATASEEGVLLNWVQDDYDTLMGYNIYRSTEKDGNYVKLNTSVIPADENTFLDTNAEPGVNYWYTFTVVFSDLTESNPAGKVSCTPIDTIAPNIYHTPVNQGYMNNNLVISCTASDNLSVASVTLYYRTTGTTEWKTLAMTKKNDRYSATIYGSDLSMDGLEYYIVASDGRNTISKGSADDPYSVVIKDASAISRIGDVDGDGTITTKDALMIMKAINGDLLLSDDEFKRADLNGDGTLSSSEALRILQYINGNVTTLEM